MTIAGLTVIDWWAIAILGALLLTAGGVLESVHNARHRDPDERDDQQP